MGAAQTFFDLAAAAPADAWAGRWGWAAALLAAALSLALLAAAIAVAARAAGARALVEAIAPAAARFDRKGRLRFANRRWSQLTRGGAAPWAALRNPLHEAVPDLRAAAEAGLGGRRRTVQWHSPSGRLVEVTATPAADGGFALLATDITGRRRAEGVLRDSEERFRLMADAAPVMVWQSDPSGRVVFANRQWLAFVQPDSGAGGWQTRIHPEDRAGTEVALSAAMAAGESATAEFRLRGRDGFRWVLATILPQREEERRRPRLLCWAVDITERRRAEEAMREARDMAQAANRTKSEFLANMSHELRTPLNAIMGFSEIMKSELFGPTGTPAYREYAEDIFESGRHLLTLINDILDVSKVEAGRIELADETVDPAETVAACLRLVAPRAEAGGIVLSAATGRPPLLRADRRRLKQIVLNLLSNAVKFTPSGGSVNVEACCGPSGEFVLAVRDTGIGIAPDDIPKSLEPFAQIDGRQAGQQEGTGLGLPLAKAMTEAHGGRLELESEPGRGTTVRIVLPAARVLGTGPVELRAAG